MKKIIVVIVIAVILLILYTAKGLYYTTIPINEVWITSINSNDNQTTLKGKLTTSAIQYKDYKYHYKDEALYIKIKGGIISLTKPKEIDITISHGEEVVKEVYLEGDSPSENILIWQQK